MSSRTDGHGVAPLARFLDRRRAVLRRRRLESPVGRDGCSRRSVVDQRLDSRGLAMFAPLSICVVYLTSRHPDEGGMYVWSKRAFGPFAGFFTGWTYWASNLPYFPALLYFAAGNALFVTGGNGGALATFAVVLHRGRGLRAYACDGGQRLRPRRRQVAQQRRRAQPLDRYADSHRTRRARVVEVRSGDARECADDPARIRIEGRHLLVGDRVCMDGAGGHFVHGRRGSQSPPFDSLTVWRWPRRRSASSTSSARSRSCAILPSHEVNASSGVMQAIAARCRPASVGAS